MKFNRYKISELIDEIAMGPFGSNIKKDCFVDYGIPVLSGNNLMDFAINDNITRYVTEEKANSLKKASARRGDIVVTHRGTLGQISFIPKDSKYDRYIISQSQFRFRCNHKVLPEYITYYFHTRVGRDKLLSNASQVGVPALARATTTFRNLEIDIPSINDQKKIVDLLETIREKIKINSKINKNLEYQARALFHQWSTGASSAIYKLSEVADINPETYSPKDNWRFVNYLDTSGITAGTIAEVHYILPSEEKLPSRARRILRKNDIVFSTVRPNQLHYGIISNPKPNMLGSTGFAVIRSKYAVIPNELIYLALTEASFIEQMQHLAEQSVSTFPSIRPADLDMCVLPTLKAKDEKFTSAIRTIFNTVAVNDEENQRLTALRGTLLPRLISGELDVSDIEI